MRQFIASLTVATVLTHALLGCCTHSAHFAVDHELAAATKGHDHHSEANSHFHHHQHSHTTPCPDESDPDHDCRHAKCQWMAASSSLDLSLDTFCNDIGAISECISCQAEISLTTNNANRAILWRPALPVRSHLAFGILLI